MTYNQLNSTETWKCNRNRPGGQEEMMNEELFDKVALRIARMLDPEDQGTCAAGILSHAIAQAAHQRCADYQWRLGPQQEYLWLLGVATEIMARVKLDPSTADRLTQHQIGDRHILVDWLDSHAVCVLSSVDMYREAKDSPLL